MRVLVAIPTFETVSPETFKSLWDMDKAGHEVDFICVRGYDCAVARNMIANETIAGGYDAVLMVDSDITVPKDALKLLLDDDAPVALGWYRRRSWDGTSGGETCFYHRNGGFTDAMGAEEIRAFASSENPLMPVSGGGLGCALIRTDVLERVSSPRFRFYIYGNGQTLSEDLYFCLKCQKADIPIFVDARVGCGHRFTRIQEA